MRPEKRVRNWHSFRGCGAGVTRQLARGGLILGITLLAVWLVLVDGDRPIAGTRSARPPAPRLQATELYGRLPMRFEAHPAVVQASWPVRPAAQQQFFSQGPGYTLLLNNGGEALLWLEAPAPRADHPRAGARAGAPDRLRLRFLGARHTAVASGENELPGKSNYYISNDPAVWVTGVPGYAKVKYRGLYPGIDLVYYGNQRQLEYDLVAAPGANPASIRLQAEGVSALRIDPEGHLLIEPANRPGALVRFQKPAVYQEIAGQRRPVPGGYVLRGRREIGFRIGAYDRRQALIIDPVLIYSSYFGGNAHDFAYAVAVDARGQVSVAGTTASSNLPVANPVATSGAIFVSKFNAAGSALIYSTYLAGSTSANDTGNAIAVDSAGNAYITGQTSGGTFPITTGALQTTYGGGSDAFVAKLAANGALVYSTYLGGNGADVGYGIAVDSSGNAYVAGLTGSANFPTVNAFQSTLGNSAGAVFDGFVARLNAAGSQLLYSTYLGGSGDDRALAIAVDADRNAYVAGSTSSHNFPLLNAFQSTNADPALCGGMFVSCTTGFVTKLSAGGGLAYSTYLGGSAVDVVRGIAVDSGGNAYLSGWTDSGDFPTASALYPALRNAAGGAFDAFVTKLHSSGRFLVYSTYLGGNLNDRGHAIAVDAAGNAYVTGLTQSGDFPVQNATQATIGGGSCTVLGAPCSDAFLVKLGADGNSLPFSTFLGGNGEDYGNAVALDSLGGIYIAGQTASPNFPVAGGFQGALVAGTADAFVLKLGEPYPAPLLASIAPATTSAGGPGLTITVNGSSFSFPSVVRWNGSPRPTTFVSTSQLQAVISATDIAAPGTIPVDVFTMSPGGGTSSPMAFVVLPGPAINAGGVTNSASLTAPITAGSQASVRGTNLSTATLSASDPLPTSLAGTQVRVNGIAAPLFLVSPGQVDFQVPWEVAGLTQAPVTVTANGVTSSPLTVNLGVNPGLFANASGVGTIYHLGGGAVTTGVPAVQGETVVIYCTGLGPVSNQPATGAAAPASPPALTATVPTVTIGGLPAAVLFSGLASGFIGVYQVNAQVPAGTAGGSTVPVVVTTNGAGSNTVTIAVLNAVPVISSLSPASVAAGSPSFTLTIYGSGFFPGSVIRWNGVDHAPTSATNTQLQTTITATEIVAAGSAQVLVFNPPPGGGLSGALSFAINNPVPAITSVSPTFVIAGGSGFTLTINGSGFVSGAAASQARWNGNNRTTTYVSPTQLQAAILGSDIATASTAVLSVFNPGPGGGTASFNYPVLAPPAINASGVVNDASLAAPVAPGSVIYILGNGLASGTQYAGAAPLPTLLLDTTVLINGIPAPLVMVSPTQIRAQLPFEVTSGTATVQVNRNSIGASTTQSVNVAAYAPGIYTTDGTGSGQGQIAVASTGALATPTGSVFGPRPAYQGETVQLQATGLGPVSNQPATGAPAPASPPAATTTVPTVTIGGVAAPVSASGLVPGLAGYYQVTVQVPLTTAPGGAVPVVLTLGGATSNTVTMAVQAQPPPAIASPNGVFNEAGLLPTVSPGSLLTIFGSNLAGGVQLALTPPYSTTLLDTTVTIGGIAAPLIRVGNGIIRAQMPYEVATGTATIQVSRFGNSPGHRTVGDINVAAYSPGLNPSATAIVPNAFVNARPNSTFADYSNNLTRIQQVYGASQFGAFRGPAYITEIGFRPSSGSIGQNQPPAGWTLGNVEISLSTTAASPFAPSATFANNIGTDQTVVYSGPLTLSTAYATSNGTTSDFDIRIPLSTPFRYDPAAGNLLLDFKNARSVPLLWVPFDRTLSEGQPVGMVQGSLGSASGSAYGATGLVTRFAAYPTAVTQGEILIANSGGRLAAPAGFAPFYPADIRGLAAASRPAFYGENIEVYGTGWGPVTNPPPSGAAALSNPFSQTTLPPIVTIGGIEAPVNFSGLEPGSAGRYVANVTVPEGAPPGDSVPVVFNIGGTASNTVTMAVAAPVVPTLTSLAPFSILVASPGFTLTVVGTGFNPASVVQWNGSGRLTGYVSPTQVTASILTGDLDRAGMAQVTVFNPGPSGGLSNPLPFNVFPLNPIPAITSLAPAAVGFGGGNFDLTVNGTGFVPASVVRWNGSSRTTTFISDIQLRTSIPGSDIATPGTAQVTVFNPAPGGGTSSPLTFSIVTPNPVPSIASIAPTSVLAGSLAFALTVNGANFISSSVVQWNGTPLATTFVGAAQLTASVPAINVAAGGTAPVTVVNPPAGGGTSNAVTFTVIPPNPVPSLSSLSPTSATAGGLGFTLTVNGTGFVSGSVVQWKESSRPTTFGSASQLTASIAAADIATAGTAQVTVLNPAPGGGLSTNSLTFTINSPSRVTVTLSPSAVFLLPGGNSRTINVALARINYAGDVTLALGALPTGVTANISQPGASNSGTIVLQAAASAPLISSQSVTLTASGTGIPNATGNFTVGVTQAGGAVTTGSGQGAPGGVSRIGVTLSLNAGVSIDTLSFSVMFAPSLGAPDLSGLSFSPDPAMPAPNVMTTQGPNAISVAWLGPLTPARTGTFRIGELIATLPTSALAGQSYAVQVTGASATLASTSVSLAPGPATSLSVTPTYLIGDVSDYSGDSAGQFGDDLLDNIDLILALRAVTSVPGFLPPGCSDRFDAMDSYPVDDATRGGDGVLDNLDLIATLRRVTSADPSRPRRPTRGLVCSTMAPGLLTMLARPAELPLGAGAVEFQREQSGEDGAARVAVYLSAYRDLDLGGLSLALGWTDSSPAAQAALRFIPAAAGAPALLDNGLPGTIAAAWLGGLQLRAGQRLLLGFVDLPAAGRQVSFPVLHGVKANDRATGRQVPIGVSRSGGTTQ